MDFSAVSQYENISDVKDCSESVLYQAVNNVISVTTINGNRIFCPLCVRTFEFKFALLDHLKNIHYHFLRRTTEKSFLYEQCPFCYANFFGRHTVIKHVLQTHSKLISQLYLQVGRESDSELSKCYFCSELYCRKNAMEFVSHVEQKHFLQFKDLFEEQFLKVDESALFEEADIAADKPEFDAEKAPTSPDTCTPNHFDFSSLKKQLCYMDCSNSDIKSILKSNKTKGNVNSPFMKRKACRVLQFDLPDENKENSVLTHNVHQSEKKLTLAEHSLLCRNKTNDLFKDEINCSAGGIQPIHSSTPNYKTSKHDMRTPGKNVKPQLKGKLKVKKKATFKSYFLTKDFVFQCGKCKKLFQENIELHFHVKKSHKLFILNLLHPCYQCAICEAKFFKNYYLKKHIILHTSQRESKTAY